MAVARGGPSYLACRSGVEGLAARRSPRERVGHAPLLQSQGVGPTPEYCREPDVPISRPGSDELQDRATRPDWVDR